MFGSRWRAERALHRDLAAACPWFSADDLSELSSAIAVPGSAIPARLFALRREGSLALVRKGADGLDGWARAVSACRPGTDPRRSRLWTFAATVDLTGAHLPGRCAVDIGGAALPSDLLCLQTTFAGDAGLNAIRVAGRADFSGATFAGEGQFEHAVFGGPAVFAETRWSAPAQFRKASFRSRASFLRARFGSDTWFREASFSSAANFAYGSWEHEVGFGSVRFGGTADFSNCRFHDNAGFESCRFEGEADFRRSRFDGRAWFDEAHFEAGRNFTLARFSGRAVFDDVSATRSFSPVRDAIRDLEQRLMAS